MAGPSQKELNLMLRKAWSIPGQYGKKEAVFLYTLARRKGNLVEIGCWMGRTTVIMQLAAQVWKAHLTTIDPFGRRNMPPDPRTGGVQKVPRATRKRWEANLRKCEVPVPELFAMKSDEARLLYGDREVAMLFIDGMHTKAQVLRDLSNWAPLVKVGGYMALHDMFFPGVRGVASAVAEWWDGRSWRMIDLVQSTIAFRRVG